MAKKRNDLIILILVIIMLFGGCGNEKKEMSPEEYINENLKTISLNTPWEDGTLGNTEKYQVFLAGEVHGFTENYEIQRRCIEYLHDFEGVRYLIAELSLSEGIVLEHYLETGKEEILEDFMESIKGTASFTKGVYDFYKWLHQYNEALPDNEKLHIFGLDIEFQQDMPAKALTILDSKKDTANTEVLSFQSAVEKGGTEWYSFLEEAGEECTELKDYYGENWKWVERLMMNQKRTLQYIEEGEPPESQLRDENMEENFWFVYEQFPKEKFFGQFGSAHVYLNYISREKIEQSKEPGGQPFGALLNEEESPLKGQVCTMILSYISDIMQWNYLNENIPSLEEVWPTLNGKNKILSLDESGSPFLEKERWQMEEKKPVCEYLQKMIFLPVVERSPLYDVQDN